MDQMEIRQLVARQRAYFQSGATLPARARVEALRALRSAVAAREEELNDALRADLGKSAFESYMCEVGMVLSELTYMIRRTPAFAADRRVRTPWPSSPPGAMSSPPLRHRPHHEPVELPPAPHPGPP